MKKKVDFVVVGKKLKGFRVIARIQCACSPTTTRERGGVGDNVDDAKWCPAKGGSEAEKMRCWRKQVEEKS